ncbi:amidohydrolase family protein [Fodinibius sp. Rm-B-1B1-1]|uniref:amidohydrolase family protein n=1 Tax=Fodinibius alkaliphilus TaxID=3140241 RepID=UPI003159D2C2
MKIIIRLFIVLLLMGSSISCTSQSPADIVVHNANIIDVETGDIAEGQTIEIRGDSIAGIYSDGQDVAASDTINASGKYVLPGLWDMHVHFRGGDTLIAENKDLLDLFIANGVTTVRDAGGDITPAVLEWKQQIENGTLLGPNIFTSGPKLDGADPSWAGSIELTSVDQVPAAFDSLESLNVDYVKLYDSTIPAEVYLAAIKEAEKRGLSVTGHMPFTVDFNDAVEAGLDATEHMYYVLKGSSSQETQITESVREGEYGFWSALSEVVETYDEETAQKTYVQMAKSGTGVVPTLHIGKVLANLHDEDHSDDQYLNYIGDGIQKTYQGRLQAAQNQSKAATERRQNLREQFVNMIPDIHQAGVPIYAGSDSGPYNSFVYPGKSLHNELQELVAAGLSPLQALQSSVINGPEFFDVADQFGKVKQGYAADLLLLNSNPLKNIKNTEDIYSVILQGELVELSH